MKVAERGMNNSDEKFWVMYEAGNVVPEMNMNMNLFNHNNNSADDYVQLNSCGCWIAEMAQVPSMQVQVRVQVLRLQVQVQVHRPTISDANEIKQDSW